MKDPLRVRAALLVAGLLLAPLAHAQGGYTKEKFPELGLSFERARNYEAIPIPPSEEYTVLYFAEKSPTDPKEKRAIRPELSFIWIDRAPARKAAAPEGPIGPNEGGSQGKDKPEDAPQKPIDSIERYVDQRWLGWVLGQPIEAKERDGFKAREFNLLRKKSNGQTAWMMAYDNGKRTLAILGMCHEKDLKEQVKIWRYTAEHIDIKEPEEKSPEKIQLFYARKPLKGIDARIQVRLDMVRGWKAEDTEHFILIYDTLDQPLVRKIARDLELLRKEYEKLFPPAKPVEAVSAVRVCKSRDEYFSYGGPPRSAGYWNSVDKELVFYDAEKTDKQHHTNDADTFIALYHEAFHQYIYYSTGELPPHSWFNEGHGDFFSGAQIKDGKLRGIGVMPWRIDTIKEAIGEQKIVPWDEMIKYEQPQYYAEDKVHICYAQGWSMIYFLRKSEQVAKKPEWAKILPTYFEILKATYTEKLAELTAAGRAEDAHAKAAAGLEARTKALDAAFAGVDLNEIQKAWEGFVLGLERPKD